MVFEKGRRGWPSTFWGFVANERPPERLNSRDSRGVRFAGGLSQSYIPTFNDIGKVTGESGSFGNTVLRYSTKTRAQLLNAVHFDTGNYKSKTYRS